MKAIARSKPPPVFVGRVFSDAMDKTCVVMTTRMVYQARIGKYVRKQKKIMCHDEYDECRVGDVVKFSPMPRRTKNKHHKVVQLVVPYYKATDPILPLEAQKPTTLPERAISPRRYLDVDIYRDEVKGLSNPHISAIVKSNYSPEETRFQIPSKEGSTAGKSI